MKKHCEQWNFQDIVSILQSFYDAGVRYLQLDDVYIAGLSSPDLPPEDLVVTTHLCRGNYESTYAFGGSYELIAPTLLAKEKVDAYLIEYDDERSGYFKPLAYVPNGGAKVVLGVVTSQKGELEDKEEIIAR